MTETVKMEVIIWECHHLAHGRVFAGVPSKSAMDIGWTAEPLVRQSEAAAHIDRLEADVARLTKELDEAQDQLMLSDGALSSMEQNRSALQRHLNDCTVRAETAEAQNKAMREALDESLHWITNIDNAAPVVRQIRATLSSLKETP